MSSLVNDLLTDSIITISWEMLYNIPETPGSQNSVDFCGFLGIPCLGATIAGEEVDEDLVSDYCPS